MPDDPRDTDGNLSRRIEELESLLAEKRIQQQSEPGRAPNIPILDDVVSAEDYRDEMPHAEMPSGPEITRLADRLEEKFSMELDETVRILKSNLKANIIEELRAQLRQGSDRTNQADVDTSEE